MRSFPVLAGMAFFATAFGGAAQAGGPVVYNAPGAYGATGSYGYASHYGRADVVHRGAWRHAPAPRHARHGHHHGYRNGVVAGALAGAVVGGVAAVAITQSRPRGYHYAAQPSYRYDYGYSRPQPVPVYGGYQTYPAAAPYPVQPYCVQMREHLFNGQGVYRGVYPVRVCQ